MVCNFIMLQICFKHVHCVTGACAISVLSTDVYTAKTILLKTCYESRLPRCKASILLFLL